MKTDYQLDFEAMLRGRTEAVHLALVFKADKQPSGRQQPFAFGLVLDNSGSMAVKALVGRDQSPQTSARRRYPSVTRRCVNTMPRCPRTAQ